MPLRKKSFFKFSSKVAGDKKPDVSESGSISKDQDRASDDFSPGVPDPQTGERRYSIMSKASTLVEGSKIVDHTETWHSLAHRPSFEFSTGKGYSADAEEDRKPGEAMIASLSSDLWGRVAMFMSPSDAAIVALSSKTLRNRMGPKPWDALNHVENKSQKIDFLVRIDGHLPYHLLCFPCETYHLRTQRGQERLKVTHVLNPLFNCPNAQNSFLPRMRLTHGRTLPFAFVQLALRAHRHSPSHGISSDSLSRRWKCSDSAWSHTTRFIVYKGHLLMRSISTIIAPPELTPAGERMLLYSASDYTPYFSVCHHWRDGELMKLSKCALSHIPQKAEKIRQQLRKGYSISLEARNREFTARGCEECNVMRRCPECPTEYLIELKMVEDKSDPVNTFKHAIVVARWSDLGDGTSPSSPEWAACNGEADFDSFTAIGKRSISGTFEGEVSNQLFLRRVMSLNPKNEKRGEAGNAWY